MERKLKAVHGWLGVIILPWVVMLGLTGLYLNHPKLAKSVLPDSQKADLAAIEDWPDPVPVEAIQALALAREIWPGQSDGFVLSDTRFRRQPVFEVETGAGTLSMVKRTGHYWLRWTWTREFYAPDGTRLNRYINWSGLAIRLHRRGWINRDLGYWLADIAAVSLVVFGVSGIVLFVAPRLRRRRNRAARRRQQAVARPAGPPARPAGPPARPAGPERSL